LLGKGEALFIAERVYKIEVIYKVVYEVILAKTIEI
jgi:hypothetical protein